MPSWLLRSLTSTAVLFIRGKLIGAAHHGVARNHWISADMADQMKLYVKAGKDGKSFGDCPFSHLTYMVSWQKKVPVELVLIDLSNKPDYFVKLAAPGGGSTPVLQDAGNVLCGSGEIASYLQEKFPDPDMADTTGGKANEVVKGIFPKFAALMKNKEDAKDAELRAALDSELGAVSSWLSANPGPFLCGNHVTIPDCVLAPRLFHIQTAGKVYKSYSIPSDLKALHSYIQAIFECDVFKETCCGEEEPVHGWKKFF